MDTGALCIDQTRGTATVVEGEINLSNSVNFYCSISLINNNYYVKTDLLNKGK